MRRRRISPCCKAPVHFDRSLVGCTVGGLWLRGWDACVKCGRGWLSREGTPCDAPKWTLANGGRSVDIGTGRIRFGKIAVETGERLDVVGLMARIAALPELELELVRLRAELADARGGQ